MTDREYNRLLDLINDGKKLHYRNFIFASLLIVLSLKPQTDELSLYLDIDLPIKYIIFCLYGLIIVHSILTLKIFQAIQSPLLKLKNNSVPFNWYVVMGDHPKVYSVFFLFLPFILGCIGLCLTGLWIVSIYLFIGGVSLIGLPTYFENFIFKVSNRVDEDGKEITLAIYLLYWFRFFRIILIFPFLFYPILLAIDVSFFEVNPIWITNYMYVFMIFCLMRYLCEFIYKYINRLGTKLGFA